MRVLLAWIPGENGACIDRGALDQRGRARVIIILLCVFFVAPPSRALFAAYEPPQK